jgi:hypothetical protein
MLISIVTTLIYSSTNKVKGFPLSSLAFVIVSFFLFLAVVGFILKALYHLNQTPQSFFPHLFFFR